MILSCFLSSIVYDSLISRKANASTALLPGHRRNSRKHRFDASLDSLLSNPSDYEDDLFNFHSLEPRDRDKSAGTEKEKQSGIKFEMKLREANSFGSTRSDNEKEKIAEVLKFGNSPLVKGNVPAAGLVI